MVLVNIVINNLCSTVRKLNLCIFTKSNHLFKLFKSNPFFQSLSFYSKNPLMDDGHFYFFSWTKNEIMALLTFFSVFIKH